MNSLIPQIPTDLFLKLWGFSIIFSIFGFATKLIPQIKALKEKLHNSVVTDKETNLPLLHGKDVRKLLNFDENKCLTRLGFTILFSLGFGFFYVLSSSIKDLVSEAWYISISGWIAIILITSAVITSIKLYIYVIQLLTKTTR